MDFKQVQTFAANELTRAQKLFKKQPNAQNWDLTVRAMLVHQQTMQMAGVSYGTMRAGLLVRIADLPMDSWPELIVRTMTSQSIGQIIHGRAA